VREGGQGNFSAEEKGNCGQLGGWAKKETGAQAGVSVKFAREGLNTIQGTLFGGGKDERGLLGDAKHKKGLARLRRKSDQKVLKKKGGEVFQRGSLKLKSHHTDFLGDRGKRSKKKVKSRGTEYVARSGVTRGDKPGAKDDELKNTKRENNRGEMLLKKSAWRMIVAFWVGKKEVQEQQENQWE